jgi:protein tyrosine/serine phosphatase
MNISHVRKLGVYFVLLTCITSLPACSTLGRQNELSNATHGIPNFAIVDPGVFRGGQPNTEGWEYLKSLGVKTVVKLNFESEGSDQEAKDLGMAVVDVSGPPSDYTNFYKAPKAERIRLAVTTLQDESRRPIYVHCLHGQDRTGLVVGIFRVLQDRYSKSEAYKEMLDYHFHPLFGGLDDVWNDFDGKNLP